MEELILGVTSARKEYTTGTHRCISPEATLERIIPLMPVMGITRIANITGLDCIGLPVVIVCRPNARSLSISQGKGISLAAAKASGLMESVEFWHAERISKPLILASEWDIRHSHEIIDLSRMPRLEVSIYSRHQRIHWIEGFDLVSKKKKLVPHECVHTDYRLPLPRGSGCFSITSNGLASGNELLEAVSHGICEVIERDANALWFAGGKAARQSTRLNLETVDDPECKRIVDNFSNAGVLTAVWNTTTDIGVPSFACEIVDNDENKNRKLGASAGMGCHTSPSIALARALTEAAQGRLTRIASSRDDVPRIDYEITRNPDYLAAVRDEFLRGDVSVDYQSVSGFESGCFADDVNWLVSALTDIGIEEVVVVDLTQDALQIPVVRIIIPGLEAPHEAPGYLPGVRATSLIRSANQQIQR